MIAKNEVFTNYKNYHVLKNQISLLIKEKRYTESIKNCDKILNMSPNNIFALEKKAYCLSKIAKYSEAIKIYDELIGIQPYNYQKFYSHKGYSLAKLEDYKNAIKYYNSYLEVFPKDDFCLHKKGIAFVIIHPSEKVFYSYKVIIPSCYPAFIWVIFTIFYFSIQK